MAEELTHRVLAVAAFNSSWELLERERTEEEDLELLEVALASRHHWRHEGGPQQLAIADWMVSRCFAELGDGTLALRFARSALVEEPPDGPAWLRASLLEGLARAHAANGDWGERDDAAARAVAALAAEDDEEDRALIEAQLASVPSAEGPGPMAPRST
ncbi:MAG TPA: hypothetical protein VGZ33_05415 [Acidimicrobiales bacterium]|nr:hypothetical protein [Acidimicrobiales bacterium]